MRWKQVKDPETGKYNLVPIDEAAFNHDHRDGPIIRGNFDAFPSPIDGTLIRTQRQDDDHCKKHNVVPSAEFSPEWYERKAKERAEFFTRKKTPQEVWERRAQIHELINRMERSQ